MGGYVLFETRGSDGVNALVLNLVRFLNQVDEFRTARRVSGKLSNLLEERSRFGSRGPWASSLQVELGFMAATEQIEVRRLRPDEAREQLDALAGVLADCVAGGASVGYMEPFSHADARTVYEDYVRDAEQGRRIILGAFLDGNLVGTAQLVLAVPPNQPHRAEVARVLVHRSARRRGFAQRLMEQLEQEALDEGKTLLVLDAVTGGDAARLYERLGWNKVGVIPNYALYPDGQFCDTTVFWKTV
jgi:GNAT superfamily N-acetyltransferase